MKTTLTVTPKAINTTRTFRFDPAKKATAKPATSLRAVPALSFQLA